MRGLEWPLWFRFEGTGKRSLPAVPLTGLLAGGFNWCQRKNVGIGGPAVKEDTIARHAFVSCAGGDCDRLTGNVADRNDNF